MKKIITSIVGTTGFKTNNTRLLKFALVALIVIQLMNIFQPFFDSECKYEIRVKPT
jgi:hypothetical protein